MSYHAPWDDTYADFDTFKSKSPGCNSAGITGFSLTTTGICDDDVDTPIIPRRISSPSIRLSNSPEKWESQIKNYDENNFTSSIPQQQLNSRQPCPIEASSSKLHYNDCNWDQNDDIHNECTKPLPSQPLLSLTTLQSSIDQFPPYISQLIQRYSHYPTQYDDQGYTIYHALFLNHEYLPDIDSYNAFHELYPEYINQYQDGATQRYLTTPLLLLCQHPLIHLHFPLVEQLLQNGAICNIAKFQPVIPLPSSSMSSGSSSSSQYTPLATAASKLMYIREPIDALLYNVQIKQSCIDIIRLFLQYDDVSYRVYHTLFARPGKIPTLEEYQEVSDVLPFTYGISESGVIPSRSVELSIFRQQQQPQHQPQQQQQQQQQVSDTQSVRSSNDRNGRFVAPPNPHRNETSQNGRPSLPRPSASASVSASATATQQGNNDDEQSDDGEFADFIDVGTMTFEPQEHEGGSSASGGGGGSSSGVASTPSLSSSSSSSSSSTMALKTSTVSIPSPPLATRQTRMVMPSSSTTTTTTVSSTHHPTLLNPLPTRSDINSMSNNNAYHTNPTSSHQHHHHHHHHHHHMQHHGQHPHRKLSVTSGGQRGLKRNRVDPPPPRPRKSSVLNHDQTFHKLSTPYDIISTITPVDLALSNIRTLLNMAVDNSILLTSVHLPLLEQMIEHYYCALSSLSIQKGDDHRHTSQHQHGLDSGMASYDYPTGQHLPYGSLVHSSSFHPSKPGSLPLRVAAAAAASGCYQSYPSNTPPQVYPVAPSFTDISIVQHILSPNVDTSIVELFTKAGLLFYPSPMSGDPIATSTSTIVGRSNVSTHITQSQHYIHQQHHQPQQHYLGYLGQTFSTSVSVSHPKSQPTTMDDAQCHHSDATSTTSNTTDDTMQSSYVCSTTLASTSTSALTPISSTATARTASSFVNTLNPHEHVPSQRFPVSNNPHGYPGGSGLGGGGGGGGVGVHSFSSFPSSVSITLSSSSSSSPRSSMSSRMTDGLPSRHHPHHPLPSPLHQLQHHQQYHQHQSIPRMMHPSGTHGHGSGGMDGLGHGQHHHPSLNAVTIYSHSPLINPTEAIPYTVINPSPSITSNINRMLMAGSPSVSNNSPASVSVSSTHTSSFGSGTTTPTYTHAHVHTMYQAMGMGMGMGGATSSSGNTPGSGSGSGMNMYATPLPLLSTYAPSTKEPPPYALMQSPPENSKDDGMMSILDSFPSGHVEGKRHAHRSGSSKHQPYTPFNSQYQQYQQLFGTSGNSLGSFAMNGGGLPSIMSFDSMSSHDLQRVESSTTGNGGGVYKHGNAITPQPSSSSSYSQAMRTMSNQSISYHTSPSTASFGSKTSFSHSNSSVSLDLFSPLGATQQSTWKLVQPPTVVQNFVNVVQQYHHDGHSYHLHSQHQQQQQQQPQHQHQHQHQHQQHQWILTYLPPVPVSLEYDYYSSSSFNIYSILFLNYVPPLVTTYDLVRSLFPNSLVSHDGMIAALIASGSKDVRAPLPFQPNIPAYKTPVGALCMSMIGCGQDILAKTPKSFFSSEMKVRRGIPYPMGSHANTPQYRRPLEPYELNLLKTTHPHDPVTRQIIETELQFQIGYQICYQKLSLLDRLLVHESFHNNRCHRYQPTSPFYPCTYERDGYNYIPHTTCSYSTFDIHDQPYSFVDPTESSMRVLSTTINPNQSLQGHLHPINTHLSSSTSTSSSSPYPQPPPMSASLSNLPDFSFTFLLSPIVDILRSVGVVTKQFAANLSCPLVVVPFMLWDTYQLHLYSVTSPPTIAPTIPGISLYLTLLPTLPRCPIHEHGVNTVDMDHPSHIDGNHGNGNSSGNGNGGDIDDRDTMTDGGSNDHHNHPCECLCDIHTFITQYGVDYDTTQRHSHIHHTTPPPPMATPPGVSSSFMKFKSKFHAPLDPYLFTALEHHLKEVDTCPANIPWLFKKIQSVYNDPMAYIALVRLKNTHFSSNSVSNVASSSPPSSEMGGFCFKPPSPNAIREKIVQYQQFTREQQKRQQLEDSRSSTAQGQRSQALSSFSSPQPAVERPAYQKTHQQCGPGRSYDVGNHVSGYLESVLSTQCFVISHLVSQFLRIIITHKRVSARDILSPNDNRPL